MKTRLLIRNFLFVAFFVLSLNLVSAQNRSGNCQIPNLTADQKTKIDQLYTSHQSEMDGLRTKRRNAATWEEKQKIGQEMDAKKTAHQNAVKALLTPDQQKYVGTGKGGNCKGNGNGRGNGKGCNGNGRGRR